MGSAMRGDLVWWYASSWPTHLSDRLRLWQLGRETVGWSWFDGSLLEYAAWSGDARRDEEIERAMVAFALEDAAGRASVGDAGGDVEAWAAADDDRTCALLAELGFVAARGADGGHGVSQFQRTVGPDDPIDDRPLPDGYRIRSFAGAPEVEARIEAHRAAFAPSTMRAEKVGRLLEVPDYRLEDDLVIEAPDGSIASFAIAWWDPVARVGEFEPVGTDPRHQRRGLSAALLCHGLRRYRTLGATLVQVFSEADNGASEALYQSVGFRRRAYHDRFRRSAD
jgi:ribosomal protein S18 acetylase RimI-like enzyme